MVKHFHVDPLVGEKPKPNLVGLSSLWSRPVKLCLIRRICPLIDRLLTAVLGQYLAGSQDPHG